jgi:hypothetical protein
MTLEGQQNGQYGAAFDVVLNPQSLAAPMLRVPNGAALPFLPAAPLGFVWSVALLQYENLDGAQAVTVTAREVLPDASTRVVDSRAVPASDGAPVVGGLITANSLTVQCTGAGTAIVVSAQVQLLPAAVIREIYQVLTNVFVNTAVGDIPSGMLLRVLQLGWTPNTNNFMCWGLNTDPVARQVQFRVTRGATVFTTRANGGTVSGSSRLLVPSFIPALRRGDVLAARVTVAPTAPVILGAALQLVPEQGV